MYNCKDSIDYLLHFLDGELPAEEAAQLQEHLKGCPPCIDFLRQYRATPTLCKRALARKIPTEVADRLTAFLRAKIPPK